MEKKNRKRGMENYILDMISCSDRSKRSSENKDKRNNDGGDK